MQSEDSSAHGKPDGMQMGGLSIQPASFKVIKNNGQMMTRKQRRQKQSLAANQGFSPNVIKDVSDISYDDASEQ